MYGILLVVVIVIGILVSLQFRACGEGTQKESMCGSVTKNENESTTVTPLECTFGEETEIDYERILPLEQRDWVEIERFKIEVYSLPSLKGRYAVLKDTTAQTEMIRVTHPIGSIRIRNVPNDHWRFLQEYQLTIFLERDPSYRLVFRSDQFSGGVDYRINDTSARGELLDWMTTNDSKVLVYTIGSYDPIGDLYVSKPTLPRFPESDQTIKHPEDHFLSC